MIDTPIVLCPDCLGEMTESLTTARYIYENEWEETGRYHCENCGRSDVIVSHWELKNRRRWSVDERGMRCGNEQK